jgi:hypothetical protein
MAALRSVVSDRAFRMFGVLGICLALTLGLTVQASLAQQSSAKQAKVILAELNESGVSGVASLVAKGDQTQVSMSVIGVLGDNPTHIHQGTCKDLDPNPQYPLTNIVLPSSTLTGVSDTLVDAPLSDLLATPHLILIHKSQKDIGTYLACGNIVPGELTTEEQAGANGEAPLPNTGIGSWTDGSPASRALLPALVATELILISALIVVRRSWVPAVSKK